MHVSQTGGVCTMCIVHGYNSGHLSGSEDKIGPKTAIVGHQGPVLGNWVMSPSPLLSVLAGPDHNHVTWSNITRNGKG